MKKKYMSVTNMGSVSLLMIFIVLCLVTFSILSLSSAIRNYHFSERMASHTSEYYNASNEATAKLREIDHILENAYKKNPGSYLTEAAGLLREKDWIEADYSGTSPTLRYQVDINNSQALLVTLKLNDPDHTSDGLCSIASWKEISTAKWNGSNSLQLMEGL